MRAKTKRLPRIDREDEVMVHEDENQHLWAVSYSDFLMALLSFFILFFSIDKDDRQNLILDIANQFQNKMQQTSAPPATRQPGSLPANLMDSLKALEVRVDKDKHALIVNFPNNFFSAGQHQLSNEQVRSMTDFLQVLSPYQSTLNIYFEGHADQQPVQKSRTALLTDNFVLSSLRASSALLLAKKLGYSEKSMFISAASSNLRNTRSLTVRIEPKEEEL